MLNKKGLKHWNSTLKNKYFIVGIVGTADDPKLAIDPTSLGLRGNVLKTLHCVEQKTLKDRVGRLGYFK